ETAYPDSHAPRSSCPRCRDSAWTSASLPSPIYDRPLPPGVPPAPEAKSRGASRPLTRGSSSAASTHPFRRIGVLGARREHLAATPVRTGYMVTVSVLPLSPMRAAAP